MYPQQVIWDLPEQPEGNVQHIAEHGLSVDDVEAVLLNPANETRVSRSSGNWGTFGLTPDGRHIAVDWEESGDETIHPLTAYETPPSGKKRNRRKKK